MSRTRVQHTKWLKHREIQGDQTSPFRNHESVASIGTIVTAKGYNLFQVNHLMYYYYDCAGHEKGNNFVV